MRPKLGQIAVTWRRYRPILGILRKRQDVLLKSEIRKKLAKYLAKRTAAENEQRNGETASRSRISAISEMRPKLRQVAVTGRREMPILGILRRRRDISRKIRNPRKIGEISRKKNGGRKTSNNTASRSRGRIYWVFRTVNPDSGLTWYFTQ